MNSASAASSSFSDTWARLYQISTSASQSVEDCSSSSSSFCSSSLESSAAAITWSIDERGGLAKIVGMAMVPSQFMGPELSECDRIIQAAIDLGRISTNPFVERRTFSNGKIDIQGIVVYPPGYDRSNLQKCVVYNNPNGCTVPLFLNSGRLNSYSPPAQILELRKCPLIMYDYRGTGLSVDPEASSMGGTRPSANTIVQDGHLVLSSTIARYQEVEMWGSSLGGGVATAATERVLAENPTFVNRISLTNHDSFTTTGKVVLPGWLSSVLGPLMGDLNAEKPMRSLLERGVRVTILCHLRDFVIQAGSRMAELNELGRYPNARVIESPLAGHANLTDDMLEQLRR